MVPLRSFIASLLIVLVSYAFSYETIKHLSKTLKGEPMEVCDDWDSLEKNQESKGGDEKDAKKEFNEYLSAYKPLRLITGNALSLTHSGFDGGIGNDHSPLVYCPPEV